MKNYEIIEHTADIGIRVKGKNLAELFSNAAVAMFDIMAEKKQKTEERLPAGRQGKQKTEKFIIKQKADDLDELFINWLNELLSLSSVKQKIFNEFRFNQLNERSLKAAVVGCDMANYKLNTEIKAATYHGLKLEVSSQGLVAEVIFDV